MAEKGYIGRIKHSGVQVVKAPHNGDAPKGKSNVKRGKDLRTK